MQTSEYIEEGTTINWTGTRGAVTGNIKYVSSQPSFGGEAGNFFPFILDASYEGKPITVQRTSKTPGAAKTQADVNWLLKLTDGTETVFKISCEGTLLANLSFSGATLAGAV